MQKLVCKISSFFLAGILIATLANFSGQKNIDADAEWHPVNFYGTLVDTEKNSDEVQNISISGLYKDIAFYIKPSDTNKSPHSNYEKLDLSDIAEIKRAGSDAQEALYVFRKKEYIEVIITFNKTTENTLNEQEKNQKYYIIERSKKIVCFRMINNKPILKEVYFDALDHLTIKGFKEAKKSKERIIDYRKEIE